MGVEILTFGCRLNTVETEVIRREAKAAGVAETIVINTCAVTGEAVRQARQAIRKARRENGGARIVVTGCAAQTEPETFAEMDEVDLVLGNAEKLDPAAWRRIAGDNRPSGPDFGVSAAEKIRVDDIMAVRETAAHLIEGLEGRTRAFVQVQNGCDHRCTFCIIPFGRGPSRSVPMGAVVQEIRAIAERGTAEVVLTGVDLTSYGQDLPGAPRLGELVRRILKNVPELKRLRLSSIDSIEVDDSLMRVIAEEERLMPHFHLSLQAGDDMILKRMKRRHSAADAVRFCTEARRLRPDIVFGADLIAGFPTETEAMFENSLAHVDDCGLTFLHVFPFSPRKGTPAARMPQLDKALIKARAERLRAKSAERFAAHLAAERGRLRQVLIERDGLGRTELFTPTLIAGGKPGAVVPARITGHDAAHLIAEAA
ncbi:tRNA (N(6)-L-threonylcarbamoyladenosine(37)-C(2))-methylthiotransferase MtaB [Segnochrobactrum spirostomi]|uniref:tRNA (N(6)-L-threonylcarbamoyladenosine(37)-C(2))-methylthiotransferase n=1 Tax=Segnochrobactrum spirostomi TaxID=2608987 RepID=A0A6A7Y323_9HYPH|nr:tRNA (N(6)-L-threonylcarbamoyladenosine(37)-C(2))-methylthiotransferase MtaB [Segnochrobactrum spirostomi]MQT12189.1 tRNA (N(6)-L-threonylcarbamoyladenosine(37)-C(2))-methylthiotransferase MtaB [Segnochrobactrum spirostomi]